MTIPIMNDPIALFSEWLAEAEACAAIGEPTAMNLATVGEDGHPDSRIVLLKGVDERGFTFYTNLTSAKAHQIDAHPHAALNFYWGPLDKQVRVRGQAERVTDAEADAYFATRPRVSQIGAWASKQSQPYTQRLEFETRLAKYTAKFAIGEVPRPGFWSGYRILPQTIEFWLKQPYRLHDRLRYTRDGARWKTERLYP